MLHSCISFPPKTAGHGTARATSSPPPSLTPSNPFRQPVAIIRFDLIPLPSPPLTVRMRGATHPRVSVFLCFIIIIFSSFFLFLYDHRSTRGAPHSGRSLTTGSSKPSLARTSLHMSCNAIRDLDTLREKKKNISHCSCSWSIFLSFQWLRLDHVPFPTCAPSSTTDLAVHASIHGRPRVTRPFA